MSKEQNTPGIGRRRFRPYPQYKDSSVEWLSKIPIYWDVKPFKALLSRNDGGVWGEDFADDGVIVLRSTEQTVDGKWNIESPAKRQLTTREASDAWLEVGDLVVTKSSGSELHLGKTSIVDQPVAALNCCFSNFMQRLRVAWPNLSRYYWYLLNCPVAREQLIFLSSTTTGLGNLNGSILGSIRVPVAPEDEQQAIATFLDRETAKIDALIEKKERLIELLQEKRTTLITEAVTKGLNLAVPMKDSGIEWLGEIPTHWSVHRLKFLASINDEALSEKTDPQFEMIYVDIGGVDKIQGILEREEYLFENAPSRARRIVRDGDVIISTVRTYLRAITPIRAPECNLIVSTGFAVVRPTSRLNSDYAAYALRATYFVENIVANSTGVSYPAIEASKVSSFSIAFPELMEQQRIAAYVDKETAQIDKLMSRIREAMTHLNEYRTALISSAVTGRIDVRSIVA